MRRSAALPGRLVLVGAVIVGWIILGRLVLPGIRWYFRRRSKGVARVANRRLRLRIPSFKMTRRRRLVERLMRDPAVLEAIEEHSREEEVPEVVAALRAERYAREIVPTFNAYLYFRVGIPLAGLLSRALYQLRVGGAEWERSAAVDDASVVFVMNHRSNMDYVVLAYLTAERAALSYAAGEWARFWPLGGFVRAMGAFFVRRGSGDALHRRVLERFVQMAVEGGLTQVVFPEGGLSRDGALREPKTGLLDYMLRRFDPAGGRDLVFVPVAIDYDWVLEDESLLELGVPGPSRKGAAASTVVSIVRKIPLALRGRRLARAAVNFGPPISVREYARAHSIDFRDLGREERVEKVRILARTLMQTIGEIMPVVPVAVIARIFARDPRGVLSASEITARARALISDLQERGSTVPLKGSDLEAALRILAVRHLLIVDGDLYRAAPGSEKVLCYHANAISHLFEPEQRTI